jgi:LmbE family N-acetylglucosaminyl deacetylase
VLYLSSQAARVALFHARVNFFLEFVSDRDSTLPRAGKIMEEVERYQSLSSDVDSQKTMWASKRSAMIAAHGSYALQLRTDYERQLNAARERRSELSDELEGVKRDWSETRKQVCGA